MTLREIVRAVDECASCLTRDGHSNEGLESNENRLRRAAFMLGGIRRELVVMAEASEATPPPADDVPPASHETYPPYRPML